MNHVAAVHRSSSFSNKSRSLIARFVLLFFLCTSLLMGSGRLGSLDAGDQLQAAFYAVHHGQFGAVVPPGGMHEEIVGGKPMLVPVHFWWQAPNKLYYQTHDIGDITLFTPIAAVVSRVSKATPEQQIEEPPLPAKLIISLVFSLFGGLTAFFIYLTLALFLRQRVALVLAAAFLPTTFLWPFCKTVWDVAPAAMFALLLLYFCARILTSEKEVRLSLVAGAGFAAAAASSFRLSFAVFLLFGFLLTLIRVRSFVRLRHYVVAAGTCFLGIIPSLVSNQVRMGAFWHPATINPRYLSMGLTMNGDFFRGFFGLTTSLNHGLFAYCPIFLLLFALPFVWSRLSQAARYLSVIFILSSLLYLCTIAKIPIWSGYIGWGPRYLVPIVPLLYVPASLATAALWDFTRQRTVIRAALVALFLLTAINNVPPALCNWPLAIAEDELAHDQYANGFYAQRAVWRSLSLGLQNKPISVRSSLQVSDRILENAKFPDLWLVRLWQKGGKTAFAGVLITAFLGGGAVFSLCRVLQIVETGEKNPTLQPTN